MFYLLEVVIFQSLLRVNPNGPAASTRGKKHVEVLTHGSRTPCDESLPCAASGATGPARKGASVVTDVDWFYWEMNGM